MYLAELLHVEQHMFDLVSFATAPDRYSIYQKLRNEAPALKIDIGPISAWLLTRYEDVNGLLKRMHARVKPPSEIGSSAGLGNGPAAAIFNSFMVMSDPPDHERLRRLANPAFDPKVVASLAAWTEDLIEKRIEQL